MPNADDQSRPSEEDSELFGLDLPLVTLDSELRIRRFTAAGSKLLHLIPSDIGRRLDEIAPLDRMVGSGEPVDIPSWLELAKPVLEERRTEEREVRDGEGNWYLLRLQPSLNAEARVDSLLLAFLNISSVKRTADEIVEAVGVGTWEWDLRTGRARASRQSGRLWTGEYRELVQTAEERLAMVYEPDRARVSQELDRAVHDSSFREMEFRVQWPDGTIHWLLTKLDVVFDPTGKPERMHGTSFDITSRREAEEALHASREQLRALTAGLYQAHEEERRRLGRELHDDFSQRMAIATNELQLLESKLAAAAPPLLPDVQSVREKLYELTNDLGRVGRSLHPSALEHLGLVAALQSHCAEFSKACSIPIKFVARKTVDRVPMDVALCLYRVAQECLRNIARHSEARNASVTLSGGKSRIRLCVSDDGKGFDFGAVPHGAALGLVGIRERVHLAGGTVSIAAQPGTGVTIDVALPVKPESR